MSKIVTADITCEKCGHQFEADVYSSINVKQNPELRQSVLNGTFFQHKCKKCGYLIDSFYEILYHDMEKNFMVWLVNPDSDNVIFMQKNSLKIAGLLPNYRLSISRYPFQWIERITTLEFGIDPRIIELYKFGLKERENWPLKTKNDFLHFTKWTKNLIGRTKFHWKYVNDDGTTEEYSRAVDANKYQAYETLIKSLEPNLNTMSWYLIDWQFPFGLVVNDDELIQLPPTSDYIEVGQNKSKLPGQFLSVLERTRKGKQE